MQSVVTFELLLLACQLERLYELYLCILAAAAANQEATCDKLGITDYDPQCIIKYEMVIFTISKRSSGRLVWHTAVERRPIQQPRGIIKLSSSSGETIAEILFAIEQKTAEFGTLLKMVPSQESSSGMF